MIIEVYWKSGEKQTFDWPTGLYGILRPDLGRERRPAAILISDICCVEHRQEAIAAACRKVDAITGFVGVVDVRS